MIEKIKRWINRSIHYRSYKLAESLAIDDDITPDLFKNVALKERKINWQDYEDNDD